MPTPTSFGEFVYMFGDLLSVSIRLIFAATFVYVVWKVIDTWIIHADDEKKREEGRQTAIVAVVVMALMAMTWGLVTLIQVSIFGG